MKKVSALIFILALSAVAQTISGTVAAVSAQYTEGGSTSYCQFKINEGPAWYHFDCSSSHGKNRLAILLSAQNSQKVIKFTKTGGGLDFNYTTYQLGNGPVVGDVTPNW